MAPPFYLEGNAEAMLRDAVRQGRLTVFDLKRRIVTGDCPKDSWHKLVVSWEAVLRLWSEQQAHLSNSANYTLLWNAAGNMAAKDQQTIERHWLRLMDAFWRGDLSPIGLTYFHPDYPVGSRSVIFSRQQLYATLSNDAISDDAVAALRGWRVRDYQERNLFGDIFASDRDGRCGLAVLTLDLEDWLSQQSHATQNPSKQSKGRVEPSAREQPGDERGGKRGPHSQRCQMRDVLTQLGRDRDKPFPNKKAAWTAVMKYCGIKDVHRGW